MEFNNLIDSDVYERFFCNWMQFVSTVRHLNFLNNCYGEIMHRPATGLRQLALQDLLKLHDAKLCLEQSLAMV